MKRRRKTSTPKYRPPAAIKIGYQDYALKFLDYGYNPGHVGLTNNLGASIEVHQTGNDIETINTLIHECLHAIIYTQGHKGLSHETEEQVVNLLANGLVGLIRENPVLIEYILGKLGLLK